MAAAKQRQLDSRINAMPIIACCYGTRPEFIKIAPVVKELKKNYPSINPVLICSGQHQELLSSLDKIFGLTVQVDLNVRKKIGSTTNLSLLTEGVHAGFAGVLERIKPDAVLVQGDAASTFLAALAAFHQHIPIFYMEAGLRTYDLDQPFPEEAYRQMTTRISKILFAPTKINKLNLINEGITSDKIYVVGNSIIDSVSYIKNQFQKVAIERLRKKYYPWLPSDGKVKLMLVTIHRRENQGAVLDGILNTLIKIRRDNPNIQFVFSVHPNPQVRLLVYDKLKNVPGFTLINPPLYQKFMILLNCAQAVITDSGGLQEEAPSFGIPIIVVRKKTERVEGIQTGWSILAGVSESGIVRAFNSLSKWQKPKGGNPYGDGKTSMRIAKIIYEKI